MNRRPRCVFPLVGAKSSGKTMFLSTAVWLLEERFFPRHGMKLSLSDPAQKALYSDQVSRLKRGERLGGTAEDAPSAFNLEITREDGSQVLVYFYDPAGESYIDLSRLSTQGFQRFVDGLLIVVDPFSLSAVQSEYQRELSGGDMRQLSPSPNDPQEVVGQLLNALEEMPGIRAGEKMDVPVAVVLTKVDAFGVGDRIAGWERDGVESAATVSGAVDEAERLSGRVREVLEEWGHGNLTMLVEERFGTVKYFAASASGRMPADGDGRPFTPVGVLAPVVWLMGESGVLERGGVLGRILVNFRRSVSALMRRKTQASESAYQAGMKVVPLTRMLAEAYNDPTREQTFFEHAKGVATIHL